VATRAELQEATVAARDEIDENRRKVEAAIAAGRYWKQPLKTQAQEKLLEMLNGRR
jgi:hypothetical protein